jgi:hypothetical protein
MNILALGDSFTQGDELEDTAQAWPSVLAELLNASVTNLAESGAGWRQVVTRAVDSILNNPPDLLVIGWPSPGRTQFADQQGRFDLWPGMHPDNVGPAQPWRLELLEYYNRYHDPDYMYQQYLFGVLLLQSFVRQHGVKCLMTVTVQDNYYAQDVSQENQLLEQHVDWTMFVGGQTAGMNTWTKDCPKGPRLHFLAEGHKRVAERFYEHIRN